LAVRSPALPLTHLLLALAVILVWGSNFVVIRLGLNELPPLTFAALRFTFAAFPLIFFVKRPQTPWWRLIGYGLLIGVGQFGLLFIAMNGSISPGLASLVVQTQVFFTIGLAMYLTGERPRLFQYGALALGALGLAWLIVHTNGEITPLGLGLVLCAAAGWAGGNTIARGVGPGVNFFNFIVWASACSLPALYALALTIEGPRHVAAALAHASPAAWAAVLWQTIGNTMFGYVAWAWLLSRHPAAQVSPLALLIPVAGMGASAIWLHESLPDWKLIAAALLIAGLALNTFWPLLNWRKLIPSSRP
jgi:O-acetylserine/cysteine efflux transporter